MIVSYAQNREDVYLYRILNQIKNGFYIDIGANDPIVDSVTKHFYDMGWSGINVEPELKWFKRLKKERPNDINLNLLISNKIQIKTFLSSKIRGQSTLENKFIKKENIEKITQRETETLNNILEKQKIKKDIHFLKIDVEGHEKEVLESIDFNLYRPWILVIETKEFNSSNHTSHHKYLNKYNYKFFFNDGVNSYFISHEKKYLLPSFFPPANSSDGFITYFEHIGAEARELIIPLNNKIKKIKLSRDHLLAELNEIKKIRLFKLYIYFSKKIKKICNIC